MAVEAGRKLDRALAGAAEGLDSRDRRWLHDLTFGTVRLRGRIDRLLERHVHRGVGSVAPPVLGVLRLGVYQLLWMGSVPDYAAVSRSVDLARAVAGEGASRLVNAVLRAVARVEDPSTFFPDRGSDLQGHLVHWHSHPEWLVRRWLARWDPDEVEALLEHDNRIPPLCVRPFGITLEEAAERLARAGIGARAVERGPDCLELDPGTEPMAALAAAPLFVQDPGAALVTSYARPEPGTTVLDLCAAPGGKALALAGAGAAVLAADRAARRLGRLAESLRRLQARVDLVVARAEQPPFRAQSMVLLDVPCTGTGTLRRHPDARWRLRERDVSDLAAVQARMLRGAAGVVSPGGVLVYATCTLEPEENEMRVDAFLEEHPEFRVEPGGGVPEELLDDRGFLVVLPQRTGFDGAFAARLRRQA